jgi:hypothetical protein
VPKTVLTAYLIDLAIRHVGTPRVNSHSACRTTLLSHLELTVAKSASLATCRKVAKQNSSNDMEGVKMSITIQFKDACIEHPRFKQLHRGHTRTWTLPAISPFTLHAPISTPVDYALEVYGMHDVIGWFNQICHS